MRVALVCGRMITNGANRIIMEHCLGLQRRGHMARIFALQGVSPFPELIPTEEIIHYPSGKLAQALNPFDFDLIINNTLPGAIETIRAALSAPSLEQRKAFANSVHFSQNFDPIFLTGSNTETTELPFHFFNRQMTCSPVIRDLIKQLVERPIAVVGNGIDYQSFKKYQRPANRLKGIRPRIGYMVASASHTKRTALAFEVFKQLKKITPSIETVVISSLPWQHQAIDKLLISPDAETKMNALSSMDVFLNTSSLEAFPLTPLEGMALGVPVVATDSYGSRCYANPDNCCLLDTDKPEPLTEAILNLLDNHGRRDTLSQAGIALAEQHDWNQVMPKVEMVYKALAEDDVATDPFNMKRLSFDRPALHNLCIRNGAPHIARKFEETYARQSRPQWKKACKKENHLKKASLTNQVIVCLFLEAELPEEAASHAIKSLIDQTYPNLGFIIIDPGGNFSERPELSLLRHKHTNTQYITNSDDQASSLLLIETIDCCCKQEDSLILVFNGWAYLEEPHSIASVVAEHLACEMAITTLPGGPTRPRDLIFIPSLLKIIPGLFLLSFGKRLINQITPDQLCGLDSRWHQGEPVQTLATLLSTLIQPEHLVFFNNPKLHNSIIPDPLATEITADMITMATSLKALDLPSVKSSAPLFTKKNWREKLDQSLRIAQARNKRITYSNSQSATKENKLFQQALAGLASLGNEYTLMPPGKSDSPVLGHAMVDSFSYQSFDNALIMGSSWLAQLATVSCLQNRLKPPTLIFPDEKKAVQTIRWLQKNSAANHDQVFHVPVTKINFHGKQWQWYDLTSLYRIKNIDLLVIAYVEEDYFTNDTAKFFIPLGLKSGATIMLDTRSYRGRYLPIHDWFVEFPQLTGEALNFERTVWRLSWKPDQIGGLS